MRMQTALATSSLGLVLLLAGCSGPAPAEQPTPAPAPTLAPTLAPTVAPTPTVEPTAAPAPNPAAAPAGVNVGSERTARVRAIAEAVNAASSYRIHITSSGKTGKPSDITMEVVKPDKVHVKSTEAGQTFELFQIGSNLYSNLNGQWMKQSGGPSMLGAVIQFDPNQMAKSFEESLQKGDTYSSNGMQLVEGTACEEIVVTPSDPSRKDGAWCVAPNSLPVRIVSDKGSTTITFTDWNSPIVIAPPI